MSQLKNIKIAVPTYDEVVPSSNKKVKIKPFRVGDEKTLLLASESEDSKQMINALKSVIGNCVEGVDVDTLASFDLEYLFVKLRAVSVGEVSELGLKCAHCEHTSKINLDLSKVEITKNPNHKSTIRIADNLGFEMKYTDVESLSGLKADSIEDMLEIIARSVKTVFYGEETFEVGEDEIKDLKDIVDSLTTEQFDKLQEFFLTMPRLEQDIDFVCEGCGKQNEQKLEGLASFF